MRRTLRRLGERGISLMTTDAFVTGEGLKKGVRDRHRAVPGQRKSYLVGRPGIDRGVRGDRFLHLHHHAGTWRAAALPPGVRELRGVRPGVSRCGLWLHYRLGLLDYLDRH